MSFPAGIVGVLGWLAASAWACGVGLWLGHMFPDLPPVFVALLMMGPRLGLPLILFFDSEHLGFRNFQYPVACRGLVYAIGAALDPLPTAALYAVVRYKITSKQWSVSDRFSLEEWLRTQAEAGPY